MTDLEERINDLHEQILAAADTQREELLDHLEQAVLTLESKGLPAPHWAKDFLAARIDRDVEDQFDNMPL
ncbi:hypothetical protein [Tropicibacter naphthalenivorans]|uniref:Uncharacterized protein n=1 Tax=Tropicibacter naphthalenivorans TaxID=441103 RepID=A0A0P1GKQ8_9RHOB|nr:hypothetical protein [Tropicibacter naphthalenivorans]CUH82653.1 hypothetical protein TRN7648_04195 [Tropicibacter naphthalenivorans]SMD10172.1 hypothetical protein SAMN04488093_12117 [Tropicibacter naphthalenivorans]